VYEESPEKGEGEGVEGRSWGGSEDGEMKSGSDMTESDKLG
jgi:hypothetical protein